MSQRDDSGSGLSKLDTRKWSHRENLALACAVARHGEQWGKIALIMKEFGECRRPEACFTEKRCQTQFSLLTKDCTEPSRQKSYLDDLIKSLEKTYRNFLELQLLSANEKYQNLCKELSVLNQGSVSDFKVNHLYEQFVESRQSPTEEFSEDDEYSDSCEDDSELDEMREIMQNSSPAKSTSTISSEALSRTPVSVPIAASASAALDTKQSPLANLAAASTTLPDPTPTLSNLLQTNPIVSLEPIRPPTVPAPRSGQTRKQVFNVTKNRVVPKEPELVLQPITNSEPIRQVEPIRQLEPEIPSESSDSEVEMIDLTESPAKPAEAMMTISVSADSGAQTASAVVMATDVVKGTAAEESRMPPDAGPMSTDPIMAEVLRMVQEVGFDPAEVFSESESGATSSEYTTDSGSHASSSSGSAVSSPVKPIPWSRPAGFVGSEHTVIRVVNALGSETAESSRADSASSGPDAEVEDSAAQVTQPSVFPAESNQSRLEKEVSNAVVEIVQDKTIVSESRGAEPAESEQGKLEVKPVVDLSPAEVKGHEEVKLASQVKSPVKSSQAESPNFSDKTHENEIEAHKSAAVLDSPEKQISGEEPKVAECNPEAISEEALPSAVVAHDAVDSKRTEVEAERSMDADRPSPTKVTEAETVASGGRRKRTQVPRLEALFKEASTFVPFDKFLAAEASTPEAKRITRARRQPGVSGSSSAVSVSVKVENPETLLKLGIDVAAVRERLANFKIAAESAENSSKFSADLGESSSNKRNLSQTQKQSLLAKLEKISALKESSVLKRPMKEIAGKGAITKYFKADSSLPILQGKVRDAAIGSDAEVLSALNLMLLNAAVLKRAGVQNLSQKVWSIMQESSEPSTGLDTPLSRSRLSSTSSSSTTTPSSSRQRATKRPGRSLTKEAGPPKRGLRSSSGSGGKQDSTALESSSAIAAGRPVKSRGSTPQPATTRRSQRSSQKY